MLAAREQGTVRRRPSHPRRPGWIDGPAVVAGALGSTETTAQVHPARFTDRAPRRARAPAAPRSAWARSTARDAGDGAARGSTVDGETLEADAVVLAMGPWTGRVRGVALPRIQGSRATA